MHIAWMQTEINMDKGEKKTSKDISKQKPTGTTCDEDIEIIEKYRKRISIINREKKALQTGKGIYTPNKEMYSKLTKKVTHKKIQTLLFLNYMVSLD